MPALRGLVAVPSLTTVIDGAFGSAALQVLNAAWSADAAPAGAPAGLKWAIVGPFTRVSRRLKALVPGPGLVQLAPTRRRWAGSRSTEEGPSPATRTLTPTSVAVPAVPAGCRAACRAGWA